MENSSWHSYSSIFTLGHKAIQDLLKGEVLVQEKVDGSQFSFGLFDVMEAVPGERGILDVVPGQELKIRSKGAVMHPEAPEKMFTLGAETAKRLQPLLHLGWTYRAEFLAKPRHNALAYDRVPAGNLIIFDINTGDQEFLSYENKASESKRLGLECVPLLFSGRIETIDQFRQFLGTVSVLGGQSIEGVVVKPEKYDLYGRDKKVLMGKFVSEAYKEVHSNSWKTDNPSAKGIVAMLGDKYGTATRWQKAIQHLREAGKIEDNVRDIGLIMREIPEDILKECEEEIKERLFAYAWPHIRRMTTRGFPEFYKEVLLRRQFEVEDGQTNLIQ